MIESPYDRALALAAQFRSMRDHYLDVACGYGGHRVIAIGVVGRNRQFVGCLLADLALRLTCEDCRTGPDDVYLCATIHGRRPAPVIGGDVVWTLPLVERGRQPSYHLRRAAW